MRAQGSREAACPAAQRGPAPPHRGGPAPQQRRGPARRTEGARPAAGPGRKRRSPWQRLPPRTAAASKLQRPEGLAAPRLGSLRLAAGRARPPAQGLCCLPVSSSRRFPAAPSGRCRRCSAAALAPGPARRTKSCGRCAFKVPACFARRHNKDGGGRGPVAVAAARLQALPLSGGSGVGSGQGLCSASERQARGASPLPLFYTTETASEDWAQLRGDCRAGAHGWWREAGGAR